MGSRHAIARWLFPAVGGLVVFLAGVMCGTWFWGNGVRDTRAAPLAIGEDPGGRVPDPDVSAALARLASEIESLRSELTMLRASGELIVPDDGALALELQQLREQIAGSSARVPVGGPLGSTESIEMRLAAIENLVKGRMLIFDRTISRGSSLRLPSGEPDRAALMALQQQEELEGGSDQVVQAHRMWTYQQVLDRYGRPDEVSSHEDYLEWIYHIPETGDNFDFHFVDGMCVLAH